MRRTIAASALAVAAAVWAAAAGAALPAPSAPQDVRGLPSHGVAIRVLSNDSAKQGVLLAAQDGRQLAWLPGATIPDAAGFQLTPADLAARGLAGQPLVQGPRGVVWRIAGGRLVRLDLARIALPGGATLSIGGPGSSARAVVRDAQGRQLATSAYPNGFRVAAGRLLVTVGAVVDLPSGHRWVKPSGLAWDAGGADSRGRCAPAALRGARILAVCTAPGSDGKDRGTPPFLALIARDGALERLGVTIDWPWWVGPVTASPDSALVAAELHPPCGVPQTVLAGTAPGSVARLVTGEQGSPKRSGLAQGAAFSGWTGDGRLLAFVVGTGCEGAPSSGLYAVDPLTLQRTLVWRGVGYARAWRS